MSRPIMTTNVIAVRERIKQEPQDDMSNYYEAVLPTTGEEDASMTGLTVKPSFSFLSDNQCGFIQVHTKTEGEQPKSSSTLMDAVAVKQETEDAEEGENYLVLDQVEVAKDEDTKGEQTDEQESAALSDAAVFVKSEEGMDIDELDGSISVTREKREKARRMQRKQEKHSNKETGHTCSVCGKVFDKNQACLRHMWQNHTGEKPYTCHICGKAFKNIQIFNCHKLTHSSDRPYSCDLCGKTFKRKGDLQQHVAISHSDERPFSCELCDKTFKIKSNLQQHKVACHSDERPYSCDLCDKTFKLKTILQQHRAIKHSNERPYSCELCDKTFKRKGDLGRHTAVCHSDERPYSCDLCQKTYKQKGHLQQHKASCCFLWNKQKN